MSPEDIETNILLYSTLSPQEQQAVDRYVAQHPELAPLLEQARQLGDLLASARLLETEPEHDEVLAYLLLTRGLESLPPALQQAHERLEERLENDPALRARFEALERRAARLDAQSDARAQFESLTGRSLEEEAPDAGGEIDRPAPTGRAPARRAVPWQRSVRTLLAAALLVVMLYGFLYLAGYLMQSQAERLAMLETNEMVLEGFGERTRGGGSSTPEAQEQPTVQQRYLQALSHLREAPASTFGLFPRYDNAALRQAETLLEDVIAAEDPGSFLQLEAYFWLGQARLALDDAEGATEALRRVVAGEGRRATEAYQQLATLHGDAAYE